MTILHTDTPSRQQIEQLFTARDAASVSIYIPTDPASNGDAERIALKNATSAALDQLVAAATPKADVAAITEELEGLVDDPTFWRYQAHTLGVLVTPTSVRTFRLATSLADEVVDVSDRFFLKPLLRAVAFPQAALVLALAQSSVRLIELVADAEPFEIRIPDLPTSAADAVGKILDHRPLPVRSAHGLGGPEGAHRPIRPPSRPCHPLDGHRSRPAADPRGDVADRRAVPCRVQLPRARRRVGEAEPRGLERPRDRDRGPRCPRRRPCRRAARGTRSLPGARWSGTRWRPTSRRSPGLRRTA